jgi:myo-inositol-1(or 4)-monophosphatase
MKNQLDYQFILQKLLEIIKITDQILITNFQNLKNKQVFYKDFGKEICTSIDLEIQKILLKNLQEIFPDAKFISEENYENENLFEYKKEKLIFIIDPIDGTSNFVNGLEFFGTSIGIMSFGELIGGIVSAPILKKIFYGIKQIGAFLKNHDFVQNLSEKFLEYNQNQSSKIKNQSKQILSCSSSMMNKINGKASLRMLGSIALSISYCSDLTFDGFICPYCKIWDFAGGIGILKSMNFPCYMK